MCSVSNEFVFKNKSCCKKFELYSHFKRTALILLCVFVCACLCMWAYLSCIKAELLYLHLDEFCRSSLRALARGVKAGSRYFIANWELNIKGDMQLSLFFLFFCSPPVCPAVLQDALIRFLALQIKEEIISSFNIITTLLVHYQPFE